jgi:hypothetical protein
MNEHLAILAANAGFDIGIHDGLILGNFSDMHKCQKFAELIIKECSELTLDFKNTEHYNGWIDYREEIKKHFGVK